MKDQSKTEIKVGIMVVVGTLLFLWILGWAKNFSFSANQKYIEIKFPTVAGLEIGDPVTVNGVRKGSVEDFKIESDDVIVRAKLDPDVELKSDATFAISMLDLMGGKKINIWPGKSSETIDYNIIQKGRFNSDIPYVMSMFGKMQEDLNDIIKDVKVTLSSMNNYLTDQQLNANIKTSVSNLKDLTSGLKELINQNKEDIRQITSNTVSITNDAKELLQNNKESIENSLAELQTVLRKSDSLLTKINLFTDETVNRKNNLGKLVYDEELFNNLNGTLKDVKELTQILMQQLKGEGINVDAKIDIF